MGRLNLNWPIYLTIMNTYRFIYVLVHKIHGSHLSMLTCTPTMNTEPIRSDEIIMDRWLTQQQPMWCERRTEVGVIHAFELSMMTCVCETLYSFAATLKTRSHFVINGLMPMTYNRNASISIYIDDFATKGTNLKPPAAGRLGPPTSACTICSIAKTGSRCNIS